MTLAAFLTGLISGIGLYALKQAIHRRHANNHSARLIADRYARRHETGA